MRVAARCIVHSRIVQPCLSFKVSVAASITRTKQHTHTQTNTPQAAAAEPSAPKRWAPLAARLLHVHRGAKEEVCMSLTAAACAECVAAAADCVVAAVDFVVAMCHGKR